MKQAKRRPYPLLARLISSTWHAERPIDSALAFVATSNRRLKKHKPGMLAQLIAEMPEGLPIDRAWDNMVPVGREIIDYGDSLAAASEMQAFMASAPAADLGADALKAMIDEGRN